MIIDCFFVLLVLSGRVPQQHHVLMLHVVFFSNKATLKQLESDRRARCVCLQVRLSPAESSDVLKRWAEHLCSSQVNQKSKAILVLLSLGCFYKVGEMLCK